MPFRQKEAPGYFQYLIQDIVLSRIENKVDLYLDVYKGRYIPQAGSGGYH